MLISSNLVIAFPDVNKNKGVAEMTTLNYLLNLTNNVLVNLSVTVASVPLIEQNQIIEIYFAICLVYLPSSCLSHQYDNLLLCVVRGNFLIRRFQMFIKGAAKSHSQCIAVRTFERSILYFNQDSMT